GTTRRKTGSEPASVRISRPSSATRAAMAAAENSSVIFVLNPHLVSLTGRGRDPELLGNLDTCDRDDRAVPENQGDVIAGFRGDFTINEEILQFFVERETERLKAISGAAIADDEGWVGVER